MVTIKQLLAAAKQAGFRLGRKGLSDKLRVLGIKFSNVPNEPGKAGRPSLGVTDDEAKELLSVLSAPKAKKPEPEPPPPEPEPAPAAQ